MFLALMSFLSSCSSSVDKAHLKLAAAKAVLRLSKYWEHKIPVDVFYLTLRTSEVDCIWLGVCRCLQNKFPNS